MIAVMGLVGIVWTVFGGIGLMRGERWVWAGALGMAVNLVVAYQVAAILSKK